MDLKIITSALLMCAGSTQAQQAATAAGGNASGSGGTASYTIGQAFFRTASAPAGTISDGVQQPFEIQEVLGMEIPVKLQLVAYPNPTVEMLNLDLGNMAYQGTHYQLFDLNGRFLDKAAITAQRTTIKMGTYQAGTYLLNLYHESKLLKTFKILKKQ